MLTFFKGKTFPLIKTDFCANLKLYVTILA